MLEIAISSWIWTFSIWTWLSNHLVYIFCSRIAGLGVCYTYVFGRGVALPYRIYPVIFSRLLLVTLYRYSDQKVIRDSLASPHSWSYGMDRKLLCVEFSSAIISSFQTETALVRAPLASIPITYRVNLREVVGLGWLRCALPPSGLWPIHAHILLVRSESINEVS